jgi:SAM-dependent methyltransferase
MLDVAHSKLGSEKDNTGRTDVQFIEHDITSLDGVVDGEFEIITICSALVLLPDPGAAIKHWSRFLKKGGRMVVDIPHERSMLSLKILSLIAPSFGISILGNRNWIRGPESLRELMENAGLKAEVLETEIFEDIPARTEEGRSEWVVEEGGRIFEKVIKGTGFEALGAEEREKARAMFQAEWKKLAGDDGRVGEEGRLWIGIGWNP